MNKPKRLITIETRGPIPQKNGIYGPISRPYLEDVAVISRMIIGRIKVREHLDNGETRILTVKDIPEITANAPKVIKENRVVVDERNEVQKLAEQRKAEILAAQQEKLKEVVDPNTTPQEEDLTNDENAGEHNSAGKKEEVVEPKVNTASLSKKERKALAAKQQRQEELVEKK